MQAVPNSALKLPASTRNRPARSRGRVPRPRPCRPPRLRGL